MVYKDLAVCKYHWRAGAEQYTGESIKTFLTASMSVNPALISGIADCTADHGDVTANPILVGRGRLWFALALVVCGLLFPWRAMAAGTWTPLTHLPPSAVGTMLLLSDGTVLAQQSGTSSG